MCYTLFLHCETCIALTPLTPLIVCCTSLHLKIVLSIVTHLILAIFVVYGEWVNLTIMLVLGTWFYERAYCTDSNVLFLFLLTNILL